MASNRSAEMTDRELIVEIEQQRGLMIAVATGGPPIDDVNWEYVERRQRIAGELYRRGLTDPNPHDDLWAWYGRWSVGDMPRWQNRRDHLAKMYQPLLDRIRSGTGSSGTQVFEEPTGWERVDRGIYEIRRSLEQADTEEQFQAIGLLCREVLISVAQAVYDPQQHSSEEGVTPSKTDAKRMLDHYLATERLCCKKFCPTAGR